MKKGKIPRVERRWSEDRQTRLWGKASCKGLVIPDRKAMRQIAPAEHSRKQANRIILPQKRTVVVPERRIIIPQIQEVTPGVRCFVEPASTRAPNGKARDRRGWRGLRYGERVLVFDTETTTDAAQRLLVGGYRLYRWEDPEAEWSAEHVGYELIEEGLVLGDGLSKRDVACVRRYASAHGLRVLTRDAFARLLIKEGYDLGTLIVGFNLPFDLGTLAVHWRRGRKRWRDGFGLSLLPYKPRKHARGGGDDHHRPETRFEPSLHIRTMDGPRALIQWTGYNPADMERREGAGRHAFQGRFLDLRRWAYALWGKVLSLEGACARYDIPYRKREVRYGRVSEDLLRYLREDVQATWRLFGALRAGWNALPFTKIPSPVLPPRSRAEDTPDLDPPAVLPHRMQSSAGIAKGLLRRIGVEPLLRRQPDFPREVLGIFMSALHGGWTEAHIQRVIVPVRLLDISSTYLTMAVLLGLWDVLAADRVDVVDATEEVRAWAETLRPDNLLKPETWHRLLVVCQVEPAGDVLPVQMRPGPESSWLLSMNRVHSTLGAAYWWALPDVLTSWVRTGRLPKVTKALRVVPRGRQRDLLSMRAWGITLDPAGDPFRSLLAGRNEVAHQLNAARAVGDRSAERALALHYTALKALAEPLAYGVHCEIDDVGEENETVRVWAGGVPITSRSLHGERPGPYFNPLIAPFPPAACRLVMAMTERAIRDAGSTWATNDTDSFAVVATERGGLIPCPGGAHRMPRGQEAIRALSFAEVEAIRARFDALSPCGGPFWKSEPENTPHPDARRDRNLYAFITGPKRFVFANVADDGRVIVRKASAHSLGHLVSPDGRRRDEWIKAMWDAAFREARGEREALDRLPFRDTPAVAQIAFTKPTLLRSVGALGGKASPNTRPRPFGFGLTVPVEDPLMSGAAFPKGWCRREKTRHRGCPVPREECRYRARCPLVHSLRVVAPFELDPAKWQRLPWRNLRTGERERITWRDWTDPDDTPRAQTLGRLAGAHLAIADSRYLGPDGLPGHAGTRGEVLRQDLRLVPHPLYGAAIPLGKHQRRIADRRAGLVDADETLATYAPEVPDTETLRAWCKRHPVTWIAREAQLARYTVERFRDGKFAELDAYSLRRLYHALLRLDVQASLPDQDALLRAALRPVPTRFLVRETRLDRVTLWRFRTGRIAHLHPARRRLLGRAFAAWLHEHPDAGLILPEGATLQAPVNEVAVQEAAG